MTMKYSMREAALAAATFAVLGGAAGVASAATTETLPAPKGRYITGDFHNHTTCSDGSLSLQKLVDKSVGAFDLDWFAQVGHGGSSARNCTLAEDPLEPVPSALGLTASTTGPYPPNTYPSPGEPATTGRGPNQLWQDTLPNGVAGIKGDIILSGTARAMWKWQEIQEYIYPVIEQESRNRRKPIFVGLEQVVPGHEHTSSAIVDGQLPPATAGSGNADAMAQFEYCFDRADNDRSRGNVTGSTTVGNNWDCSVPGSPNNSLLDPAAQKIIVASGTGSGTAGHVKTLEGIKWMAAFYPGSSFYVPAHLERAGVFNPNGNNGFNVEHLRDFNNAAPDIAFGFESMPGHQAESNRGSYTTGAVGGGTYGGTGIYAAQVGGVWDALLGEGRNWFFFASSDYHNRGTFGPDQRETTADFFPGEYTKDYVFVNTTDRNYTKDDIVNSLRSGNSFVANGGLIDGLVVVACQVTGGVLNLNNCATMGQRLVIDQGDSVKIQVTLRDPEGVNNSPYSFPNPSLRQIDITQPLNAPVLDHVDLITGNYGGKIDPSSPNYAGLINSPAATNPTATVSATFNSSNWQVRQNGKRVLNYRINKLSSNTYFRLRGTNLPPATPFETDSAGNPLLDFGSVLRIPCADLACPNHLATDGNGAKTSSFDIAGWSDLWFYSNPVFIEVRGSTPAKTLANSAAKAPVTAVVATK